MDHFDYIISSSPVSEALITYEDYRTLECVLCSVRGAIATVGAVANVFNLITFKSMGLADSMSVSFVFLALSDLLYLVTVISRATSFIFMTVESLSNFSTWFPVEPYGVYIFTGHAGRLPYILSNMTTTFLAVARCVCVASPLRFKHLFGRRVTLITLLSLAVFSVASYLPVMMFMGMSPQYFPQLNTSRPALWVSPDTEVTDIIWAVRDAFIPFASQLTIFVCFVIMVNGLRLANRFRQKHARFNVMTTNTLPARAASDVRHGVGAVQSKWETEMKGKELKVVQQVVLISVVYIVCNTPTILINIIRVCLPQFTIEKLYHNVYYTATGVKHLLQTINASFTILVYFRYNTKFRRALQKWSCCKSHESSFQSQNRGSSIYSM